MSIDLTKKVPVISRTAGSVSYYIESSRQHRVWLYPGFEINIPVSELVELKSEPGGMNLLTECLVIKDPAVANYILEIDEVEPEYNYGLAEVKALLYEASDDQLADALEFAPDGVLTLIRAEAIKKIPNSTAKVRMINEKFKINLNTIISNSIDVEDIGAEEKPARVRRAAPVQTAPKTKHKYERVASKEA